MKYIIFMTLFGIFVVHASEKSKNILSSGDKLRAVFKFKKDQHQEIKVSITKSGHEYFYGTGFIKINGYWQMINNTDSLVSKRDKDLFSKVYLLIIQEVRRSDWEKRDTFETTFDYIVE